MNRLLQLRPRVPAVVFDPEAQAFITAAGITDNTQKNAINKLVLDLKSNNLWTKMIAIYPFVGGNASAHSYNLKNTSLFQIAWQGTVTQNSNGITGGGNGCGIITISFSVDIQQNNNHLSIYSRTNNGAYAGYDFNGTDSGATGLSIAIKWNDNNTYISNYNGVNNFGTGVLDTSGFFVNNRSASNSTRFSRNAVQVNVNTAASVASTLQRMAISARALPASVQDFSVRNYAFASIGTSLTNSETSDFYTVVQAYQTTLGRQV